MAEYFKVKTRARANGAVDRFKVEMDLLSTGQLSARAYALPAGRQWARNESLRSGGQGSPFQRFP